MGNSTSLGNTIRLSEGWPGSRPATEGMQVANRDERERPQSFLVAKPDVQPVPAPPEAAAVDAPPEPPPQYAPPAVRDFVPLRPLPPEPAVVRKVIVPAPPARSPKLLILAGAAIALFALGTYLGRRPAAAAAETQ